KAAKGYGSALPTHRAQASGSFSADGSPAPAPQAKCTKRADPDPKILPACKPPPIRDRKTESANPRYGEGVFSKLLERIPLRFEHSLYGERSSCTLLPRNRQRSVRSGAIDAEWCARRPCAGQPSLC